MSPPKNNFDISEALANPFHSSVPCWVM